MSTTTTELSVSLHAELLTDDTQFDSIRERWDELLNHSEQCCFFLRWAWNRLWWRTYAPPKSRLFLITCSDEYGRLFGVAPFYWRRAAGVSRLREVLFLGTGVSVKTSEYLDIVSREGYAQAVAETIAGFLRQNDDWDRLWLWNIPAESKILPYFQKALGAGVLAKLCDRSNYVDTRSTWEAVRSRMSGDHLRRNIDRLSRKLFREHTCEFRLVDMPEDLDRVTDDLVRLHQARWQAKGGTGSFAMSEFERFMREAIRFSLTDRRLRFWILVVDGKCRAALVAFVDYGIAHYFQSGFDPDYAKLSLGRVMLRLCIRDCIEAKDINAFDFMGGGAAYKDQWSNTTREAIELELLHPGMRSRIYVAQVRTRQVLGTLYHAIVPHSQPRWIRARFRSIRPYFPFSRNIEQQSRAGL